jgi:hypothetical protein
MFDKIIMKKKSIKSIMEKLMDSKCQNGVFGQNIWIGHGSGC